MVTTVGLGTRRGVASRRTTPRPGATGRSASSTTIVSAFAAKVNDAEGAPLRVVTATACAGDSDEPMPSTIASTDGIAARGIVHDEHSPVRNFVQGVLDD